MEYKVYTKTVTTKVSKNGAVTSVSENISVNWEMKNTTNITIQQQQQSPKGDSPGIA